MMRERRRFRRFDGRRSASVVIATLLAAGLATAVHATTPAQQISIPGITVEATLTPIRWLGLIPTKSVRFELTVVIERQVNSFSQLHYQCLFVDANGAAIGVASRGIASRDAFTAAADGRLVSVTHEELMDIGPVNMRCRATKLEK